MGLSAALDVLIGMALIFAIMSAATSAIREAVATIMASRAKNLRARMIEALGDETAWTGIENALVGLGMARRKGVGQWFTEAEGLLAYVDRAELQNILKRMGKAVQSGTIARNAVPEPVVRLLKAAGDDLDQFDAAIVKWVDNVLAESSRRFARSAHVWLFGIGFALSACFDVSAIRLADYLWHNEAVRTALVAEAERRVQAPPPAPGSGANSPAAVASDLRTQLAVDLALPVRSWITEPALPPLMGRPKSEAWMLVLGDIYLLSLFGWLITAAASVLGAKYWFDAIQTLMRFRPATA